MDLGDDFPFERTLGSFPLRPVLGASLLPIRDALRVEDAADDVIADAGQIAHATAADEHDRVLLKIVAFAGNVGRHFDPVGKADASHLPEGRVRLLRRHDFDLQANPALLRAPHHGGMLRLAVLLGPRRANQLIDRRHSTTPRQVGAIA